MSTGSHRCSWQGCSKTFQREDLLQSHERAHAGEGRYPCTKCDRSYARSDVLTRHMVNHHGATPPPMGRPRKVPCSSCISSKVVCDGISPTPCHRCVKQGLECQYGRKRKASATPSDGRPNKVQASTGGQEIPVDPSGSNWQEMQFNPFEVDSTATGEVDLEHTGSSSNQQDSTQIPPADLFLLAATASDNNNDWLSLLGMDNAKTLDNPSLDWGITEPDRNIFDVLNTHAPNSPNWDFFRTISMDHAARPPLPGADQQSPEDLHGVPSEIPDGQPFDSPWPHIDKPRTSDSALLLPITSFDHHSAFVSNDRLTSKTRQTMLDIISHSHRGPWPIIDTTSFPSTQTLTVCVNLYHRHFHDWAPVMDREAFQVEEPVPLVVMAMSAIGAMYSRDGLQRLGVALNELVRRAIYYIRENDRRFNFETNIVQSLLLQTQFAFYCGSQKAFQQAEISRSVLVQSCKRMHLLRPGRSAVRALTDRDPTFTPEDLYRAEKDDQKRARLGWSIYLLDAQVACLLNLPAQLSVGEIAAAFPGLDTRLSDSATFAQVLDGFLTNGTHAAVVNDFGYSIIAYTLYRLCMDAAAVQSIYGHSLSQPYTKYTLAFPVHVKQHPQQLLDRLRLFTMNTHLPPTPLLVSCAALANHSHLQFTRIGLIELVKAAAGKGGTLESRTIARQSISSWVNADPAGARNVFAHAAMLSCLLLRHTFDTPSEVVWTFDAALCMWSVIRFSVVAIAMGKPQVTISWSESPQVDAWVVHGGGIGVQGLGDAALLTPYAVLKYFIERLNGLSWSLAQQYAQVLNNILQDDHNA